MSDAGGSSRAIVNRRRAAAGSEPHVVRQTNGESLVSDDLYKDLYDAEWVRRDRLQSAVAVRFAGSSGVRDRTIRC